MNVDWRLNSLLSRSVLVSLLVSYSFHSPRWFGPGSWGGPVSLAVPTSYGSGGAL